MPSIPTRALLDAETEIFFKLHWGLPLDIPRWDYSWKFSGPVPNYLLGGLYALFAGESLLYLGLGASRGGGIYKDRGISRRLMAHVLQPSSGENGASYCLQERWSMLKIDMVATLGFDSSCNYLAPALEDYLIGRLAPEENRLKNMNRRK